MAGSSPAMTRSGVSRATRLPGRALAGTNAPVAEKPKKPQKLRARLPRGLEDRGPAAIAATRADGRENPRSL